MATDIGIDLGTASILVYIKGKGVLPSISLASSPIALILLVSLSNATTEGSFNTTPFPLTYKKMFEKWDELYIMLLYA